MLAVIVVWTVTLWVSTPCPDYKPNPYTGEYPLVHCLVLHGKYIDKEMSAVFAGRETAEEFIKNAPDDIRPRMRIIEDLNAKRTQD